MWHPFRNRRRARLRATPLASADAALIDRNVPLVRGLDAADRAELHGIVQVLLDEKTFEGCGGLTITDAIRLTIAAQAALLLLHRDTAYYPTLNTILVYPHAYVADGEQVNPDGTVTAGPQTRLGESWHRGALVVSWSDVRAGAADPHDGRNVTLHEFAHQLDGDAGGMEGAPVLPAGRYRAWARVLGEEFEQLRDDVHRGHRSLLDPYGATNPAEFFAVATELFFERPAAMKQRHPELYAQLAGFYRQNPAAG